MNEDANVLIVNWPAGVPMQFAIHFLEACRGRRASWDALCEFPVEQAEQWVGAILRANGFYGKSLSQQRLRFWRNLHPLRN